MFLFFRLFRMIRDDLQISQGGESQRDVSPCFCGLPKPEILQCTTDWGLVFLWGSNVDTVFFSEATEWAPTFLRWARSTSDWLKYQICLAYDRRTPKKTTERQNQRCKSVVCANICRYSPCCYYMLLFIFGGRLQTCSNEHCQLALQICILTIAPKRGAQDPMLLVSNSSSLKTSKNNQKHPNTIRCVINQVLPLWSCSWWSACSCSLTWLSTWPRPGATGGDFRWRMAAQQRTRGRWSILCWGDVNFNEVRLDW